LEQRRNRAAEGHDYRGRERDHFLRPFVALLAEKLSTPGPIKAGARKHAKSFMRWSCCATAASGHVAAAPPISLMNFRRRMCPP